MFGQEIQARYHCAKVRSVLMEYPYRLPASLRHPSPEPGGGPDRARTTTSAFASTTSSSGAVRGPAGAPGGAATTAFAAASAAAGASAAATATTSSGAVRGPAGAPGGAASAAGGVSGTRAVPGWGHWAESGPHIYLELPDGASKWHVWMVPDRDDDGVLRWSALPASGRRLLGGRLARRAGVMDFLEARTTSKIHHLLEHAAWAHLIIPSLHDTAPEEKRMGEFVRHISAIRGRGDYSLKVASGRTAAVRALAGPAQDFVATMQSFAQRHYGLQTGDPRPAPVWPPDWYRNDGAKEVTSIDIGGPDPIPVSQIGGIPGGVASVAVVASVEWTPRCRLHKGWVWGRTRPSSPDSEVYLVEACARPKTRSGRWIGDGGLLLRRVQPILVASQACLFREDRRAEGYHSMIMSGSRMWLKDPFAPCEYVAFADMPLGTCWGMWPFEFSHRGLPMPSRGHGGVLLWAGRGRQAGDVELWSEEPGRMVLLDANGAPKAPLTTAPVSRIGKVPAGPVDPTKSRSILIINPATHRDLYGIPRPVPEGAPSRGRDMVRRPPRRPPDAFPVALEDRASARAPARPAGPRIRHLGLFTRPIPPCHPDVRRLGPLRRGLPSRCVIQDPLRHLYGCRGDVFRGGSVR